MPSLNKIDAKQKRAGWIMVASYAKGCQLLSAFVYGLR
jgi:hypothetical protein